MDEPQRDIRLLTLSEAAQRLQVSTRKLHRMIRNAHLPAFKVGGQWRLRETQLHQWIEQQENPSAAGAKERRRV
jgi:excisionase family DNA binding protein